MSIRTCVWPDCPARFPVDQGPSVEGWRAIERRFLLCPFHSDVEHVGHAPTILRMSPRERPVEMGCACRGWSKDLYSVIDGVLAWQDHTRVA